MKTNEILPRTVRNKPRKNCCVNPQSRRAGLVEFYFFCRFRRNREEGVYESESMTKK